MAQEGFTNALASEDLRDCINELEERYKGTLQIERGVREIYELFQTMAFLVGEKYRYINIFIFVCFRLIFKRIV